MVDIINITVERNRFVRCDVETLARDGEALVHRFVITIPEKLSSLWPYLDFELPNGEKYKTARLAIEGNVITYDVPAYVLNGNGDLKTQIVLQNENGRVWKSNVKTFHVRYSVNAVDDIPEKEDFIAEAQKILDEVQGGGGGSIITDNQRQILLCVVLADAAVNAVGLKTSCGADAALDNLHKIKLPFL